MLNFKNKTMKKLLLLTKTLLAAVLLCVGASNAWAQKTTWTYASSGNTYGAEFSGSKSGLVTVQFGATSEAIGKYLILTAATVAFITTPIA